MSNIPVKHYNQTSSEGVPIKSKWWEAKEDLHVHAFAVARQIREAQSYRSLSNLQFARLYENMEMMGLQAGLHARVTAGGNFLGNRASYNVIAQAIDTVSSKLAKNKPRPMFLTKDGDWEQKQRAKRMNQFMEGQFDCIGTGKGDNRTMYGIGRRTFVDSGVFGLGATKFFIDEKEETVKAERVLAEELIVDEVEGMYEMPRQIHQMKYAFRSVIAAMFPKQEAKILAAAQAELGQGSGQSSADMILVLESWHLPSGKDATDGKRAISIENCTLFQEEYTKPWFPFLFQRWKPRVLGFYGQGIAEELLGIQLQINKTLRNIHIAQHLMAVPQIWLEMQSKQVAKHIDNELGGIKYYVGREPKFITPQAMTAEIYNHLETLYQKAFQIIGTSLLSVASQKPAGLDAAVALREYQDIESERFMLVGQRYEDYYVDAAYMISDLMDDLVKLGKNPVVKYRGTNGTRELRWKDVRVPKDSYTIGCYPTAFLPSTPSGKLSMIQDMINMGMFTQEEARELLDYPDLKGTTSLKLANMEEIKRLLEKIIETREYDPPEPHIDLQLAKQLAQAYYLRCRTEGAPTTILEHLNSFMEDCRGLIEKALKSAPGVPGVMPPGLPPEAMPPGMPPIDQAIPAGAGVPLPVPA